MDDNDQSAPRPLFTFGPGMRAMLLLALYFSCTGIFLLFSSSDKLGWLMAGPGSDYGVGYAWLSNSIFSIFIFGVPALVYANIFPLERFGFFRIQERVSPLLLIFGALAMIVLVPGIDQVATWISQAFTNPEWKTLQDNIQKQNQWLLQMPTFGDLLLCLLAMILFPPIILFLPQYFGL